MKVTEKALQKDTVDNFIFDTVLVKPINDIINGLNNGVYRDCDIKWLNCRLYQYTQFAATTLGINFPETDLVNETAVLNQYNTDRFIEAFKTLLNYYKKVTINEIEYHINTEGNDIFLTPVENDDHTLLLKDGAWSVKGDAYLQAQNRNHYDAILNESETWIEYILENKDLLKRIEV